MVEKKAGKTGIHHWDRQVKAITEEESNESSSGQQQQPVELQIAQEVSQQENSETSQREWQPKKWQSEIILYKTVCKQISDPKTSTDALSRPEEALREPAMQEDGKWNMGACWQTEW
jgi:hypothetical protein